MRKLLTILCLFFFITATATRITVSPQGSWGGYFFANSFAWNYGDTLVLKASEWTSGMGCAFDGFRSIASARVVIINEGNPHTNLGALLLRNCWNIKAVGIGASDRYGFVSDGAFSAIDIDGRSKSIEISNWDITNAGYGIRAKQDPACPDSMNYPNFHMDSIKLHDCRIRFINQDGIYGGNTAPTSGRPIFCTGVGTISPIPMRLSNFTCYNIVMDSIGRTAIQLSGCDSGFSRIYHDTISRCGYEVNNTQGSGIILGGMTKGTTVDSNYIRYTFQFSILSLGYSGSQSVGFGANYIRRNNCDSSGMIPLYPGATTLTNTTSTNWPIRAGGPANDITFYLSGVRTSGTTAATWYIQGSVDGISYSTITSVHTITNAATTIDTIHLLAGDPSQYYKVVVSQTGTQVNVWSAFIMNPGYPFGIAANCLQTYPVGDSATTQINDNIVANPNPKFISAGIVFGAAVPQITTTGNSVCNNTYQNGSAALVTNQTSINITSACGGGNVPPVVSAGDNQSITLPTSSTTLTGSAYDIDGTITGLLWTRVSGPNTPTITTPTTASTTVTGMIQGTYVFRLTATDNNSATGSATMSVVVVAAGNIPPVANAGPDQSISLPATTVMLSGSGTDADGEIVSYAWTKVSGSFATIVTPTLASTLITDLVAGTYVFKLTVVDDLGAIGTDNVTITVNGLPGANLFYRPIVIDHTKVWTTDHSNFPILISITADYLKSVANGGLVVSPLGWDIYFSSDSLNNAPLKFEIEDYNPVTGSLKAWVKISNLSHNVDSTIYLGYYNAAETGFTGDRPNVWSNGFIGVYHLASSASDATANGNAGVITGAIPGDGQINGDYDLSGTSQYINLGQTSNILSSGNITVTAWINPTDYANFNGIAGKTLSNQPNPYDYWLLQGTGIPYLFRGNGLGDNSFITGTTAPALGVWSYISVTVEVDTVRHYLNGATNNSGTLTNPNVANGSGNVYIGSRADFVTMFKGGMDEVRFSNAVRSAGWIKTEYYNQSSPSTFYTVGEQNTISLNNHIRLRRFGKLKVN